MLIARIEGFTRELAKDQPEYARLPIRDEPVEFAPGQVVNGMVSAWEPTPQELAALNAGGKVYLRILGASHPPVSLWCEGPREDAASARDDIVRGLLASGMYGGPPVHPTHPDAIVIETNPLVVECPVCRARNDTIGSPCNGRPTP